MWCYQLSEEGPKILYGSPKSASVSVPKSKSRIIVGAARFETTAGLGSSRRSTGIPPILSRRRKKPPGLPTFRVHPLRDGHHPTTAGRHTAAVQFWQARKADAATAAARDLAAWYKLARNAAWANFGR